jgi:two-component system, NtrC family, response regulator HydG
MPEGALSQRTQPGVDDEEVPDGQRQSPVMRRLFERAGRVAPREATVVITGETGVGKERLARWLHAHSRRADRPFVPVNCGAFPDSLLDTHLFGHVRGAFTGAVRASAGIFEAAEGGTLFLDEIGEVSPAMQVKLLRVLQEREVQRVGEWRLRPVDVRLIAATNRVLRDEVAQGRFRADLFYRLHVVELHIPPLRDRPDDLRRLAGEFLERTAAHHAYQITGYTPDAWGCLLRYDWPGNVRELENAIEEACALATGSQIEVEDLPDSVRACRATAPPQSSRDPLADLELAYLEGVLLRHQGNRRRTAEALKISLSTLKRRLRRHRRLPVPPL